jgi:ubiquinone/menaquinone biosynthesis C-methylase UbiE
VREDIKNYWEERAKQNANSPRATTDDVYLRKLELSTIVDTITELPLPENSRVLDVGCGDGYTTLHVADALPKLRFLGVDYSENMIRTARQQLATQGGMTGRVAFKVGDAANLKEACGDDTFEIVMTDRCLINLTSLESQTQAIAQIAEHTRSGGYYIAIENFVEGQDNMNASRRAVGLPDIPVRWHNRFFKQAEFVAAAEPFFDEIRFQDFSSSYYFATRVIYSAMCQMRGEQPDYEHEIHQLAVKLPWTGQFSPIRMVVLRRRRQ